MCVVSIINLPNLMDPVLKNHFGDHLFDKIPKNGTPPTFIIHTSILKHRGLKVRRGIITL